MHIGKVKFRIYFNFLFICIRKEIAVAVIPAHDLIKPDTVRNGTVQSAVGKTV